MESTVPSHTTARITRSPGKPYGIQVSACVQARSDTAASAGQITGMSNPDGQTARNLVASHSSAIAAPPYSIGQSVSAVVETGSVNIRAGYIDWRPATSPDRPKVNTVRTYRNVAVSGTITTTANRSSLSMLRVRLDSGISSLIVAKTRKYPARATRRAPSALRGRWCESRHRGCRDARWGRDRTTAHRAPAIRDGAPARSTGRPAPSGPWRGS